LAKFLQSPISVREAAIDLIGKFVLTRPEVANHYYKMLTERILDTGVSVRKRVIKILRDLCLEVEDFPFTANACVRMIKRVNDDEEGIKKLVLEVFSKLWFTPVDQDHREFKAKVFAKVTVVIDVVANCPDVEWLQEGFKIIRKIFFSHKIITGKKIKLSFPNLR
jgi:cohesin loading factor subunit SCC2